MSSQRTANESFSVEPIAGTLKRRSDNKMTRAVEVIDLTGDGDEEGSVSYTVDIDPHGDLELIVGEEKVRFVVYSQALCRSSPVWQRILYGPSAQSRPTGGREWKVQLPEDSPAAFEIILNLVHWPEQPNAIPKVDLNLAFEVTVLTNKYSMTHCLATCARAWIADLLPTPDIDEHGDVAISWAPPIQWLWIAQELGDLTAYLRAFQQLALHCGYFPQRGLKMALITWSPEKSQYEPILGRGSDFSAAGRLVLMDLIEQINFARVVAIREIASNARKDVRVLKHTVETNRKFYDTYHAGQVTPRTICQANNIAYEEKCRCDLNMLSNVFIAQQEMEWTVACEPEDQMVSAKHLRQSIINQTSSCEEHGRLLQGKAHRDCTPFRRNPPSLDALDRLVDNIAKTKSSYIHLQAMLLGLDRGEGR